MDLCRHCGKQSEQIQDGEYGLVCSACGMVNDQNTLQSEVIEHIQGTPTGQIMYDKTMMLGSDKVSRLFTYLIQVEQAGYRLGADGEIISMAKKIFEGFSGEFGRIDVRIASALYAACQECRKPMRLNHCLKAAGVPEEVKCVRAKVMGVSQRQNILIPYQNPESSAALRILDQYHPEVTKIFQQSFGGIIHYSERGGQCEQDRAVIREILETTKKLIDFFDVAEATQQAHSGVDRLMVAIMMSTNYHRRPLRIKCGLMSLWKKLLNKSCITKYYCYSIYNQIKHAIERWAQKNLAQEIIILNCGKFELRYLDVILALYPLHKQAKQEALLEKFNSRFSISQNNQFDSQKQEKFNSRFITDQNNEFDSQKQQSTRSFEPIQDQQHIMHQQTQITVPISEQVLNFQQQQQLQKSDNITKQQCMDIQVLQNSQQQQQLQKQDNIVNQQCMDIQLGQYVDVYNNNVYCMDIENSSNFGETELSELNEDEVDEFIKTPQEIMRDTLLWEIFNNQNIQQKQKQNQNFQEKQKIKPNKRRIDFVCFYIQNNIQLLNIVLQRNIVLPGQLL